MNSELEKLTQIKADFIKLDKQYRESKAYGDCCDAPSPAEQKDEIYNMIQGVYRYIDYIQSSMYAFQDNLFSNYTILPRLTPSQLEKLLKAAGAEKDFDVIKRSIFASKDRQGNVEFEVDLGKKS
jgi:hypothetical protein